MFRVATAEWRRILPSVDEADCDRAGLSSHPYGSDAEDTFMSIVSWQN